MNNLAKTPKHFITAYLILNILYLVTCYVYENCSIKSGEFIGTNDMIIESLNRIVLKEKTVFAHLSTMILQFR